MNPHAFVINVSNNEYKMYKYKISAYNIGYNINTNRYGKCDEVLITVNAKNIEESIERAKELFNNRECYDVKEIIEYSNGT